MRDTPVEGAEEKPRVKSPPPLRWWHLLIALASLGIWADCTMDAANLGRHSGRHALLVFSMVGLIMLSPFVAVGMMIRDFLFSTERLLTDSWLVPRMIWEAVVLGNLAVLLWAMYMR